MDKKAILAVSFGTSYQDTLERTIGAIERQLAAAFPDRSLIRAFTSGMICRKLRERDGIEVPSPAQALEQLLGEGVTDVVIQPTHVINGAEYDKLMAQAAPYRDKFARLAVGKPLLTSVEDYEAVAQAIRIQRAVLEKGWSLLVPSPTNQQFPILPDRVLEELSRRYVLSPWGRVDEGHSAARICTSWSTRKEDVEALIRDIQAL